MTPHHCRIARGLLKWPQVRLAAKCSLSEGTIRDFESGRRILRKEKIAAIRQALELAGVVFTSQGPSMTAQSG
ncbi:helix-turn-helix transcriptional regulator [Mesorhizobium sp. B2-4-15]|nr:helix-turn-helix transcriptional regulator [Mesorhizobium sp. B2-4-15]TPM25363.1 helix-turn-helix transcriptional regulator [Mesorhizobium sp. B2-3-5]